jgi:hypothetical protein
MGVPCHRPHMPASGSQHCRRPPAPKKNEPALRTRKQDRPLSDPDIVLSLTPLIRQHWTLAVLLHSAQPQQAALAHLHTTPNAKATARGRTNTPTCPAHRRQRDAAPPRHHAQHRGDSATPHQRANTPNQRPRDPPTRRTRPTDGPRARATAGRGARAPRGVQRCGRTRRRDLQQDTTHASRARLGSRASPRTLRILLLVVRGPISLHVRPQFQLVVPGVLRGKPLPLPLGAP